MGQRLGQHFLHDRAYIELIFGQIQNLCEELLGESCEAVVEIGPGEGVLTEELQRLDRPLYAIEKDTKLQGSLQKFVEQGVVVVWNDVLAVDLDTLAEEYGLNLSKTLLVGNLPYYITSPIFRKFFGGGYPMVSEGDNYQLPGGVFLIQKEVGEKIMTAATKKSYLRWLLNNQYDVFYEFTVPPQAFTPPPKVDSAVVSFVRKDKPIFMKNDDLQKMRRVLDIISPYKRKTLGKIQKLCGSSINIPTYLWSRRLEELGWDEMKEILGIN